VRSGLASRRAHSLNSRAASWPTCGPDSRRSRRHLQVDPELGRRAERLREEPRRRRSDAALPPDDLVDALQGDAQVTGELHLADRQGTKELHEEDLAGVRRKAVLGNHEELLGPARPIQEGNDVQVVPRERLAHLRAHAGQHLVMEPRRRVELRWTPFDRPLLRARE
jgi:hypothetical protein